ncbi:hypothetical protein VTL71DRAFT_11524 [Oculimacula yallundae]|uniref:N-acetyltransferase domain-containing protein n=1 Tax=Oculimacula yallundae TaxID=86028 RepID=A0ABR4CSL5_9HELO
MLLTSLQTAKRLEEADQIFTTRLAKAVAQIHHSHATFTIPLSSGGVASVSLPSLGRTMNRIMGFGMRGPVSEVDLAIAEDMFAKNGVETLVCLCTHADSSARKVLAARGYVVEGFMNCYARELTDADLEVGGMGIEGVEISRIPEERLDEFPGWSAEGFRSSGGSEFLLDTLGRAAVLREDTRLYYAIVGGKVVSTSGTAFIQTSKGGVALFYIGSTVPEYCGRGIQAALMRFKLADARREGFEMAAVQALCGSGSSRNVERVGFRLAYTRVWFVKGVGGRRCGPKLA